MPGIEPRAGGSRPNTGGVVLLLIILAELAGAPASVHAEKPPVVPGKDRQWSASIRWENDTFSGADRFYTDGISLAVSHTGPSWLDPVARWLPWGEGRRTVTYDVGQIMVTPADTTLPVPDPTDRPYAGLLYAGLSLHVDREHVYHGLKFITGVVGPWSFAGETQQKVHELIGSGRPRGWDYQLHNEPILNLVYEHRRRYRLLGNPQGFSWEALPMANVMLGNVLTQGQIGGQMRFGWHVPEDFGSTLMRGMVHLPPPRDARERSGWRDWGLYVYGGVSANFVLRNITLDGNTWKDSPSVDKEWFLPAGEVGMGLAGRHFLAAFSYAFWGKEFEGQNEYSQFGALSLSWLF